MAGWPQSLCSLKRLHTPGSISSTFGQLLPGESATEPRGGQEGAGGLLISHFYREVNGQQGIIASFPTQEPPVGLSAL